MRLQDRALVFSPSDLVNFLGCRHAVYLDRCHLAAPLALPAREDPFLALLQAKGVAHERRYLAKLKAAGRQVVEIADRGSQAERRAATLAAMRAGAEVIYQGALTAGHWQGYADFLLKVPGRSAFGSYVYEALDTKLAQSPKPGYALQLSVYSMLLAHEQRAAPRDMHIVLGDGNRVTLRVADIHYYFGVARERFEAFVEPLPAASMGEPCAQCGVCRWRERCESEWERTDHLKLVANITRGQRTKLESAGISTMDALGALDPAARIAGLQPATLQRIAAQARLQAARRHDGRDRVELLKAADGRGFARLPKPHPGDLFFDMEGDPFFEGGLEYLFGFVHHAPPGSASPPDPQFVAFWGHSRADEKRAFEHAIDFITDRVAAFPDACIYHYASYEAHALSHLAMLHGTRESEVDHLLRTAKLVDLYQVVREAIQVSEPGYSIKNLEKFYMPARSGEVQSAGASVLMYDRWRQLQDPKLLEEIAAYNEADCRSTLKLRDWLLTLRPGATRWFEGGGADGVADPARSPRRRDAEQRALNATLALLQAPKDERPFRELVGQLLEFHRRENKPEWWAMFHRQELSEEELIDDAECIGGLRPDAAHPPYPEKRSTVHTFRFPPQDFKLRLGDRPKRAATLKDAGEVVLLDEEAGRVSLKIGNKVEPYDAAFSLIPPGPLDADVLTDAVYRYAQALIDGTGEYAAVSSILKREHPRVRGLDTGEPIVAPGADVVPAAVAAIARMDATHMLVQGPPGTGKTFLSANAIVELLACGRRVGVASNSHKAINNLLQEIERQALGRGITFRGAKKCSADEHLHDGLLIVNSFGNAEVSSGQYDLVAGTVWMFARPEFDQSLDYLFIDEAGQVSLANVVAMGVSAQNIVLVGDQMQLAQPIQGSHPGASGQSALEFALQGLATVPPDRGIFLPLTRRMHPDVCRFISEAVYEGRLQTQRANQTQRVVLDEHADPALRASGLGWVSVVHEDCSQKSAAEAARIEEIHASLLQQRWTDRDGNTRPIGLVDILVVAPYNMQVNLLKSILPPGARVGTVDKFQGQEATVVLVSMTASTAEDVSRGLEFLYSRHRLNVAISRARCLALVVASPRLLEASCNTIGQMLLVNTLCFVKNYAESDADSHTDSHAAAAPPRAELLLCNDTSPCIFE